MCIGVLYKPTLHILIYIPLFTYPYLTCMMYTGVYDPPPPPQSHYTLRGDAR